MSTRSDAWREQAELERQGRRVKEERIVRAARLDPELPMWALCERFGWPEHTIADVLKKAGVRREPEGFAAYRNRTGGRRSA